MHPINQKIEEMPSLFKMNFSTSLPLMRSSLAINTYLCPVFQILIKKQLAGERWKEALLQF